MAKTNTTQVLSDSYSERSNLCRFPTRLSTNGMSHPAFTPQPQSIAVLWPALIPRPAEDRRLSWPGWLVTYRGGIAVRRRSPISVLNKLDVE